MQIVSEEERVVQFPAASAAFKWAEEFLSRYPVESQIGKIMRGPPGEFSRDELKDQALLIVKLVSRVEPARVSLVFRYVYGREDQIVQQDLMDALMRHLYEVVPGARGKHGPRMMMFVRSAAEGFRRYRQFGRKQSHSRIAGDIGMARQSFSEGHWPDLIGAARGGLKTWLEVGEKWIGDELKDRGFVA